MQHAHLPLVLDCYGIRFTTGLSTRTTPRSKDASYQISNGTTIHEGKKLMIDCQLPTRPIDPLLAADHEANGAAVNDTDEAEAEAEPEVEAGGRLSKLPAGKLKSLGDCFCVVGGWSRIARRVLCLIRSA